MESLRYESNQRIKNHRRYLEEKERRSTAVKERGRAKNVDIKSTDEAITSRKKRNRFKLFSVRDGMDMPFFFLVLTLLVIGIVMMFSASYA
ncbi:MAG: hypothetical protein UHK60_00145, partial [Acutalibacteraceae bacterium]|nr:hypothetical protein [Acutalibacteraceae bacterium]